MRAADSIVLSVNWQVLLMCTCQEQGEKHDLLTSVAGASVVDLGSICDMDHIQTRHVIHHEIQFIHAYSLDKKLRYSLKLSFSQDYSVFLIISFLVDLFFLSLFLLCKLHSAQKWSSPNQPRNLGIVILVAPAFTFTSVVMYNSLSCLEIRRLPKELYFKKQQNKREKGEKTHAKLITDC